MENKIYLVGDVRYTESSQPLYEPQEDSTILFLISLQNLMEKFGVVKLDISMDPFKFKENV